MIKKYSIFKKENGEYLLIDHHYDNLIVSLK